MVGSTRTYFYMVVFAIALSVAVADNIEINDAPEEVNLDIFQKEMEDLEEQFRHRTKVHHFARHGLCNHMPGKLKFYKALQNHFHHISDHMKIVFIMDICSRKDKMLNHWVKEIFDRDGDGYISHFEKELYDHD
ncbi:hypothetical protein DPMN_182872 [Dreissena polymorpha]|uniref:EF-hand domain-containing protein n=1 Tax=Dreissena polymorpha TaxID=45954 RepID=A0A9D4DF12_DREPO|nr:hypothetical protein DPMN_182872 [Dreissena polymorpha]